MASTYDLQEQEQIDAIKHFWARYGTWITVALVVIFVAVAGWFGYRYWQDRNALQASALYDAVAAAEQTGDLDRVDQALADIKAQYGSTSYAQRAALLAAKIYFDKGRPDPAKAALTWATEQSTDVGLQAIAKMRLAAVLAQQKQYDEALAQLNGSFPATFQPLVADRRGDVYVLQGKKPEATQAYLQAYRDISQDLEYRTVIAAKLDALGIDPETGAAPVSPAPSEPKPAATGS